MRYSESADTFHFLHTKNEVPFKTEFKPAVQVLSRKPAPKAIARHDPTTGLSQMRVEDDDGDDDDVTNQKQTLSPEEQRLKSQREREEKQRRYEEARQRLFGGPPAAGQPGSSSSGNVTPPMASSGGNFARDVAANRRARGRGGRSGANGRPISSTSSAADDVSRRPKEGTLRPTGETRQLYDPNDTPRPESVRSQGGDADLILASNAQETLQPVRTPRGPDGSGRGGFGFGSRGNKDAT